MAGYFDKNKDYSEAIAKEGDAAKREALLSERQSKIDSMGLGGSVASNEAVSNWTGGYRPYYASTSGGGSKSWGFSVSGLYDEIERSRLAAFETAKRENQRQLQAQRGAIETQYADSVTRTQVNARLSATGNEEKLAALGLSGGGKYAAPTSGYTETARIQADNALKNGLNGLSAAKQTALSSAESAAAAADTALRTQNAQAAADAAMKLADVALQQQNADRGYALDMAAATGYLNGTPTLETRKYQSGMAQDARELATKAQKASFENALTRWKTYGYVLPADAGVLGVPAGTGTSDERYSAAALRLNQIKTAYQTRK